MGSHSLSLELYRERLPATVADPVHPHIVAIIVVTPGTRGDPCRIIIAICVIPLCGGRPFHGSMRGRNPRKQRPLVDNIGTSPEVRRMITVTIKAAAGLGLSRNGKQRHDRYGRQNA
jgi:hypothetical protein